MTDEEKAIKDLCVKCSSYDFCKKRNQLHCAETVAYIKGLAEGEKIGKEKQWIATEKAQKKTSSKIKELEKENAELSNSVTELTNSKTELENKVTELEKQIEFAKRTCDNCNNYYCAEWAEGTKCHSYGYRNKSNWKPRRTK